MPRQKLKKSHRKVPYHARLSPELDKKIKGHIKKYDRTKTQVVEIALTHYFDFCENHPLTKALTTNRNQIPKL